MSDRQPDPKDLVTAFAHLNEAIEQTGKDLTAAINEATWKQAARDAGLSVRRVWFHRPQIWWPRWTPVWFGHDEFARRTLVIGWTFTGQVIIALSYCGDPECITERDRMIRDFAEEPW